MTPAIPIIRGLSLWQPWAALIAGGHKRLETRSYGTTIKGYILICSTAGKMNEESVKAARRFHAQGLIPEPAALPRGCVVAVARLLCSHRMSTYEQAVRKDLEAAEIGGYQDLPPDSPEYFYGNYAPGRWAWLLWDVRPLPLPLPAKGGQRLWIPTPDLIERVRATGVLDAPALPGPWEKR